MGTTTHLDTYEETNASQLTRSLQPLRANSNAHALAGGEESVVITNRPSGDVCVVGDGGGAREHEVLSNQHAGREEFFGALQRGGRRAIGPLACLVREM